MKHKPSGSKAQGGGLRIQEKIIAVGWNSKRNCHGHNSHEGKVRNMREKLRRQVRRSKTLPKRKIMPIVCINALEQHLKILRFYCLDHPWPWIWQPYFCVHLGHSIKVNVNTPYSIQLTAHSIWWEIFKRCLSRVKCVTTRS